MEGRGRECWGPGIAPNGSLWIRRTDLPRRELIGQKPLSIDELQILVSGFELPERTRAEMGTLHFGQSRVNGLFNRHAPRSERRSKSTLMLYRCWVCYFDGVLVSTLNLTVHLRKLGSRSAVVQCRCASPLAKPRTVSTFCTSRPEHPLLCPRSPAPLLTCKGRQQRRSMTPGISRMLNCMQERLREQ